MSDPRVSVVIPVYNDPDGIAVTLASVLAQDYTQGYEVIPVDNDSTDRTPDVIGRFADAAPETVRPATETQWQSSYAARNAGIEAAAGEIIAFLDADMTAPSGWLAAVADHIDDGADYLGYEIDVYHPGEDGAGTFWGWYDSTCGLPTEHYFRTKRFVPTSALAVHADVFGHVGRFNPTLVSGGDKEFGHRCHDHPDIETAFTDEITVEHPARTSFAAQYRKAIRIGRGMAQLADLGVGDDEADSHIPVPDYVLPPSPRTLKSKSNDTTPVEFLPLYAADAIVSYLQLSGAVRYVAGKAVGESRQPAASPGVEL